MASLDLSPTCKEIKYTVHGSTIYIVAIDMRDKPFFFQSMDIDLIEVRSLSLKAKKILEYHIGRKVSGRVKCTSVKPREFFRDFGQEFV